MHPKLGFWEMLAGLLLDAVNALEAWLRKRGWWFQRPHERRRGKVMVEFANGVRPRLSLHAVVRAHNKTKT